MVGAAVEPRATYRDGFAAPRAALGPKSKVDFCVSQKFIFVLMYMPVYMLQAVM